MGFGADVGLGRVAKFVGEDLGKQSGQIGAVLIGVGGQFAGIDEGDCLFSVFVDGGEGKEEADDTDQDKAGSDEGFVGVGFGLWLWVDV